MVIRSLNLSLAESFKTRNLILLLSVSLSMGMVLSIRYHDASASLIDDLFGAFKNKGNDKANTGSTTQDFKVYENTSAGIATQYPSSWKVNSTHDPEDPGLVTTFSGPKNEIVELAVDPLGNKTVTLNQAADDVITFYQNSSKDFKLLQLDTGFSLAGKPAYKLGYISRDPDTKNIFRSLEVATILKDKEYSISYIADPDSYPTSLPLVQKIIDSFRITR
jgi:hypothetical protein